MTADEPDNVKITWEAICLDGNKQLMNATESNMCENVGIGDEVLFQAKIEVALLLNKAYVVLTKTS